MLLDRMVPAQALLKTIELVRHIIVPLCHCRNVYWIGNYIEVRLVRQFPIEVVIAAQRARHLLQQIELHLPGLLVGVLAVRRGLMPVSGRVVKAAEQTLLSELYASVVVGELPGLVA